MTNTTANAVADIAFNNHQGRVVSSRELAAFVDGLRLPGSRVLVGYSINLRGRNEIPAAANQILADYESNIGGADFAGSLAIYGIAAEFLLWVEGYTSTEDRDAAIIKYQGKHSVAINY